MFLSSTILTGLLLVGNVLSFPQVLDERGVPTNNCNHDNLYRCFVSSTVQASAVCSSLTPFTTTISTVTTSTYTTTTTTLVGSTETDTVTSIITTTLDVAVATSTATVNVQGQALEKRATAIPPPDCLTSGTTYPASRITSACSCIGVPALTVSTTYVASTTTGTSVSTSAITTTTSTTTASTTIATSSYTSTQTVTCGAPSTTDVITNGDFECDTLSPWTVYNQLGGDTEAIVPQRNDEPTQGKYSLETTSNYYAGNNGNWGIAGATVGQTLNTVPGVQYQISFELHIDGGGGNDWSVSVGSGPAIASGSSGFSGWTTFTGTFTAATASDQLNIWFQSGEWAYADFYWDNFVIAAM